ncbi:hypothetical protein E2C01_066063 [Portunus trituberculatus]|uniref:Uncharacterized protein n=1 Tax=Portunus trituberculatus TaxID=210409 RepID=A0A5B7HQ30_PORTR|nr:hypothetical protein [Portunus trituberculatus]
MCPSVPPYPPSTQQCLLVSPRVSMSRPGNHTSGPRVAVWRSIAPYPPIRPITCYFVARTLKEGQKEEEKALRRPANKHFWFSSVFLVD